MPTSGTTIKVEDFITAAETFLDGLVQIMTALGSESPEIEEANKRSFKEERWPLATRVVDELNAAGYQSWEQIEVVPYNMKRLSIVTLLLIHKAKLERQAVKTY